MIFIYVTAHIAITLITASMRQKRLKYSRGRKERSYLKCVANRVINFYTILGAICFTAFVKFILWPLWE